MQVARQIVQAVAALTDLAASALAVLDQLLPLLNCACRGSAIPTEELAPLGPTVHTARVALQGVVAGFAAETLRPAL